MFIASRANVVLEEKDDSLQNYYLERGYDILDMSGAVLAKAVPTDINALTAAYKAHVKKIAELEAEIKSLKEAAVTKEEQPKATRKRKGSEE